MDLSYKQYVITSHELRIQGMEEVPVAGGYYIYVGKDLQAVTGKTAVGDYYCLLGDAFCSDTHLRTPLEDLMSLKERDIYTVSRHWTGRWVLIIGNELITDACGLMSAFYSDGEDNWLISSSIALLSSIIGINDIHKVYSTGLTWHLLPGTIHNQIKLLFCTQKILLNTKLEFEFHNRFAEWQHMPYEGRVSTITNCLVTGIKNIVKFSGRKPWVALTAGKDSRLTFAAAIRSGEEFETYTARHKNMIDADRKLPIIISQKYSIRHHLLNNGLYSKAKYDEYCAFCGYNSLGADAEFYATGQFEQIPSNAINIKSGLFEAGQKYSRSITGGNDDSFEEGLKKYYKSSFEDSTQVDAFNEWMAYQKKNPMPGIDIRDRFYLEQRLNGWAAALEQSLTINSFATIQIANSAVVLGCLLYTTADERNDLKMSYDLIRALDSRLLDYPVNRQTIGDSVRIILNGIKRRLLV